MQADFAHPAVFNGMLHMATARLPVHVANWTQYVASAKRVCGENERVVNDEIRALAVQRREQMMINGEYATDPWMFVEDWTSSGGNAKKKQQSPRWFDTLCGRQEKGEDEMKSSRSQTVPRLLRLCWNGYPLVHHVKHGWCFWYIDRELV